MLAHLLSNSIIYLKIKEELMKQANPLNGNLIIKLYQKFIIIL